MLVSSGTPLYLNLRPMERIPYAPHTLIDTRYWLPNLPVLLSTAIPQQLRLLPDTLILEILDAYRPLGAIDVVCYDDWVFAWPGRHRDFDLRVALSEGWERGLDEGVHALGRAPPVAVVEGEGFAGQDEGAYAVLQASLDWGWMAKRIASG